MATAVELGRPEELLTFLSFDRAFTISVIEHPPASGDSDATADAEIAEVAIWARASSR